MENIKSVKAGQRPIKEIIMQFNKALKDHCKGAYQPATLKLKKGYILGLPETDSTVSKKTNSLYRGKGKNR